MEENNVINEQNLGEDTPQKQWELSPEEMLFEAETGQKVSITRTHPKWADTGWLETFPVPDGVPVSLEMIEARWGGGNYLLRILREGGHYKRSFNVEIAGTPRNKNGKLAKNPDIEEEKNDKSGLERIQEIAAIVKMMQPEPQKSNDINTMLEILSKANDRHIETLQNMVNQKTNGNSGNNVNQFDISQLARSVKQIKEMTSLFDGTNQNNEEDEEEETDSLDFFSRVMNFFDTNGGKGDTSSEQPEQEEQRPSLESMASVFNGLGSEERAAVVGAALNNMTEEERELAFQMRNYEDEEQQETYVNDSGTGQNTDE